MKRTFALESILFSILFVFAALSPGAELPQEPTFLLSPGDVTEATIGTSGSARLRLTLTPEKCAELLAFAERNLNKRVRIVVGDKLRSEPYIRERIVGPSMEIFVSSAEDAVAVIKTLMTSTVRFEQLHRWTDSSGETHYAEKPASRAPAPSPVLEPVQEDKNAFQALQGSWCVLKATMNGKENRDPSLLEGNWTFKGNELNLQSPQKGNARFTLKLDAKATPRAFRLTAAEPAAEAAGWMLFSREGANLKLAFYDNLQGRPQSFEPGGPHTEPELIVVILAPKKCRAHTNCLRHSTGLRESSLIRDRLNGCANRQQTS